MITITALKSGHISVWITDFLLYWQSLYVKTHLMIITYSSQQCSTPGMSIFWETEREENTHKHNNRGSTTIDQIHTCIQRKSIIYIILIGQHTPHCTRIFQVPKLWELPKRQNWVMQLCLKLESCSLPLIGRIEIFNTSSCRDQF